ncbi:hypothetical protein FF38_01755 [Lucilia cuprina]|uniref:Uncharacterized protein n=1 Tax=Lucilia cuprina TaxID=7375 RepID=A0A0L0BT20_LUCCU|nr:hypothetical protein FF38_01755 [Lucilia cuprina]
MSLTTFLSNSDAKTAPHSSRRGNDTDFNGATLVLKDNSMKVKSFASTKCPGGKSFKIDLSFEVHFLSSNPAADKALTN